MPRAPGPPSLNLSAGGVGTEGLQPSSPSTLSPRSFRSPRSPRSIPASPLLQDSRMGESFTGNENMIAESTSEGTATSTNGRVSPSMRAISEHQSAIAKPSPKHGRDASKSFFSNLMASKSSHRLQSPERHTIESTEKTNARSRASSKDRVIYALKSRGSTPDLPKTARVTENPAELPFDHHGSDSASQPVVENGPDHPLSSRKPKPRLGGILSRTKSTKLDDGSIPKHSAPNRLNLEEPHQLDHYTEYEAAMKTAPLRSDYRGRAFKEQVDSPNRNRSADRPPTQSQETLPLPVKKDRSAGSLAISSSFKDGAGAHLLSNIHQTGKGVGDRLGRASKGFLGKITRSGSSNERELITDDNYACSVINLPLIQQTRRTRIAKRLERSRDKTEFWMPALPWRCIDYLNMNGCEEEGLYRIPGSGKDVKHWQRRFDTEHDINLFDEPELYDINTIGSMFKSWLRELPDEIFPKNVQQKIAEHCMGVTKTPQLLKDELSKLPPFNYYLLFAITCHLSLLHSFADKNKMDYRNLCICFQPCLKIDGFCFQFLVQDWKNCWQGCWTEKEFLEEEYRYEREGSIAAPVMNSDSQAIDDRAISSSDSSQHLQASQHSIQQELPGKPNAGTSQDGFRVFGNGTSSAPGPVNGQKQSSDVRSKASSKLPDLGPPLSPIEM